MQKRKEFANARFSGEVLRQALARMEDLAQPEKNTRKSQTLAVEIDDAKWQHDSQEEFFSDYRRSSGWATFSVFVGDFWLSVDAWERSTTVLVDAPARSNVEAVFDVFEQNLQESLLPELLHAPQTKPTIFIGHGHDSMWRDLKDHLHEKHSYPVEAYEIGARAGHAVRDILEEMLANSSFALLVMTAEDDMPEGGKRARQNVVHEAGLFQGRLGFKRAIALVEEGTDVFSNISGIDQIRFSAGNIKETFGDVVATIHREFPLDAV